MLILLGISAILYGIYILLTKKHSLLKNTALLKNQKQYFLNEAIVFFYWGIILILYNFVNHYTNFIQQNRFYFIFYFYLGCYLE